MKPVKKIVYLPALKENIGRIAVKQEAFVFTPEELNEYTANVIKQALETAAEKAEPNILNKRPEYSKFTIVDVDKQSITNTFEETFKKFEV